MPALTPAPARKPYVSAEMAAAGIVVLVERNRSRERGVLALDVVALTAVVTAVYRAMASAKKQSCLDPTAAERQRRLRKRQGGSR